MITNKNTADLILEITLEAQEADEINLKVHDALADLLETRWKGKKITRRLEAQVRDTLNLFPAETIHYLMGINGAEICIWGKGTPWETYDKRQWWHVAYHAEMASYGGRETFEKNSPSTGRGARERIAQRAKLIEDRNARRALANAIDAKIAADRHLKELLEYDDHGPYQADRYSFAKLAES